VPWLVVTLRRPHQSIEHAAGFEPKPTSADLTGKARPAASIGFRGLSPRSNLYALASTSKFAPSARATLTRLPAGQSGPDTRHTVSSMRMVPTPPTIGLSRVNSRPT